MLSGRMSFNPCATPGGTQLAPFRIHLPDAVIGDLQTRSRATCRPETETADEWSQHEPLARPWALCRHPGLALARSRAEPM